MVGDARKPLPTLTIGKLDLGLKKFTAGGFSGDGAAAVVVHDVRFSSPDAITLGGRRADELPPLKLNLVGGVEPLVGAFDVAVALTPFANEPRLTIDVNATGIRGDGVTKVLPALASRLDGSRLKAGTFKTSFDGTINFGRKGPRDFGVDRGFTAMFDVKPLEFRAEPDGPVLAGVGQVHGEGIKVEPKNGNITVKALEVGTPLARAYRDDRGINALGLTLLMGKNESAETLTEPASQPGETPAAPPGKTEPTPRPANEIRLDRFTVTGADILIEDRTAKPFTVVPIKGLDVDVQGLSNQLPWNGKAVRFSVLSTSDKVALPPRKVRKRRSDNERRRGRRLHRAARTLQPGDRQRESRLRPQRRRARARRLGEDGRQRLRTARRPWAGQAVQRHHRRRRLRRHQRHPLQPGRHDRDEKQSRLYQSVPQRTGERAVAPPPETARADRRRHRCGY
ncbi:MAG: hypothetical protein QM754_02305 [Tepidisphaeraceae bacterium]